MNKVLALSLLLSIGLFSCKNAEKEIDKLQIAENYYAALDASDGTVMNDLITDSLLTKIPEYEYQEIFTKERYIDKWLKWDSVFEPTYKILHMVEENGTVKATVSKIDARINFLQQEPFITNEILRFQNDRISIIETEYTGFNEVLWQENRTKLLNWIEENHPELNGFIYEQTKAGGLNYKKAIELFKNSQ